MKRLSTIVGIAIALAVSLPAAAWAAAASGFPTWSQHFTKGRFTVLPLFNNEAVLDKETGLVWEQSPDSTSFAWAAAIAHCYQQDVGGRKGWRLPTVEELASLLDTTVSPGLPAGHPFSNLFSSYWSATTLASDQTHAWIVVVNGGSLNSANAKTALTQAWCVRGSQGIDGVQ